jgi:DNA polymerase III alpha subunit
LAHQFIEERQKNGVYKSLENFIKRTDASLEQLIILIRCGAFRFLNIGKKELLWEAHLLKNKSFEKGVGQLFEENVNLELPKLDSYGLEDLYDEIELIGFPVSGSLFDMAKSKYRGDVNARTIRSYEGRIIRVVANLVTYKTIVTKGGNIMKFGTFIDVNGEFIDTVHFPNNLKNSPLRGSGLYLIEGKVVVEYDSPAIDVYRCAMMPMKPDPRSV